MDSKKTHRDWALIEEWWPMEYPFYIGMTAASFLSDLFFVGNDFVYPSRAFSGEAQTKRREAQLTLTRERWGRKLERRGLLSRAQLYAAGEVNGDLLRLHNEFCEREILEKLRTAPKSSAVGRLRTRMIHAVPELSQLYEARELAASAKKAKPAAATQRGRL